MQQDSLIIIGARKITSNKLLCLPQNVKGTVILVSEPPQHSLNPMPKNLSETADLDLNFSGLK